jgi:hypothetical protein
VSSAGNAAIASILLKTNSQIKFADCSDHFSVWRTIIAGVGATPKCGSEQFERINNYFFVPVRDIFSNLTHLESAHLRKIAVKNGRKWFHSLPRIADKLALHSRSPVIQITFERPAGKV